jgi:hypothetical protein
VVAGKYSVLRKMLLPASFMLCAVFRRTTLTLADDAVEWVLGWAFAAAKRRLPSIVELQEPFTPPVLVVLEYVLQELLTTIRPA